MIHLIKAQFFCGIVAFFTGPLRPAAFSRATPRPSVRDSNPRVLDLSDERLCPVYFTGRTVVGPHLMSESAPETRYVLFHCSLSLWLSRVYWQ